MTGADLPNAFPYFIAIERLISAEADTTTGLVVLAGYAVIYCLPCLVLLLAGRVLHQHVQPWLQRLFRRPTTGTSPRSVSRGHRAFCARHRGRQYHCLSVTHSKFAPVWPYQAARPAVKRGHAPQPAEPALDEVRNLLTKPRLSLAAGSQSAAAWGATYCIVGTYPGLADREVNRFALQGL